MEVRGLYGIMDADVLRARGLDLRAVAEELRAAGVGTVQWRAKSLAPRDVLAGAAVLREVFGRAARLILNDRADLALLAAFDGMHVGQDDLSVEDARLVLGPHALVGVSTHTEEQVRAAAATSADYVAVGPVFATGSKADAEPVIGLLGVRRARALTGKPLVAIGGITRGNGGSVVEAGADALAVISGLLVADEPVQKVARDFLNLFR